MIKTMDNIYGDKSNHECCRLCGYCITCGDCEKYGCGAVAGDKGVQK